MIASDLALKLFNKLLTVSYEGSVVIIVPNRPTTVVNWIELDLGTDTVIASVGSQKFHMKAKITNEEQAKDAINEILEIAVSHHTITCKRIRKAIEDIVCIGE